MDLADIVGIPTKAISLNGTLSIRIWIAREGWASAHYEPDKIRHQRDEDRGAGTLAHEWFHALDQLFPEKPARSKRQLRPGEIIYHIQSAKLLPGKYTTGTRLSETRYNQILDRRGIKNPQTGQR
jgi:hypothetical protein